MAKRRPSGDGMVRQKPNGDWEGRIVVGHKKNGDPIFRYATDKNQKDFLQKFNQLKEEYRGVELTEDSNMTVSEWLNKWLTEYLPGTIRPQTVERHRRIVNTYIRPHIGKKKLAFLSTNEVQRMYVKLKKTGRIKEHPVYGHELADNTIIDIHATLHRAMEIAVNNHLIPKNPTKKTKRPKKKKKDLRVLNNAELDILMQAIDSDEEWGDFFYLELTTGLRRGEICGLRWRDFDEKEGIIRIKTSISLLKGGEIYEGEPKTDESKRKILLPKITADRLRNRKRTSEWIFPNLLNPKLPIAPPVAYRKAKSFLSKLNLPNISFHDLRHTFATHALATGVDAITLSTILGHTNASFTVDTYTHVTGDMQKRASEIVGSFLDEIL